MTFGQGPTALRDRLESDWQATRVGRGDLPPIATNPEVDDGVLPVINRSRVPIRQSSHDVLHLYSPEQAGVQTSDQGYKEQNTVETVQIDLGLTDRTDDTTGERLSAKERMIGDRDSVAEFRMPPYPGILGETLYILEGVRRGFSEWDKVSYDVLELDLGNSNADASVSVELEAIARNTVV